MREKKQAFDVPLRQLQVFFSFKPITGANAAGSIV